MKAIKFVLNGVTRKVVTDPRKSLLKVIREDLKLTGTKEGCSAYQKIFKAKVTYGTA